MIGKPVTPGKKSFFSPSDGGDNVQTLKAKVAIFTGACSSSAPFTFQIGGRSGLGAIGTPPALNGVKSFVTSIAFEDALEEGQIELMPDMIQPNFFNVPSLDAGASYSTLPFGYRGMTSKELSLVTVECSDNKDPVDIIVLIKDRGGEVVDATVTHDPVSDDERVKLRGFYASAQTDLHAEHLESVAQGRGQSGERSLTAVEGTPNSITLRRTARGLGEDTTDDEGRTKSTSLVHVVVKNSEGMKLPKTLVVSSERKKQNRNRKLQAGAIKLESSEIDENGDVAFKFASLQHYDLGDSIKLDARIGIAAECNDETFEIVDISAMLLTASEPTLIINGGWFRRATEIHGIQCDWEPVLVDAIITDPESKYAQLGRLDSPTQATIMKANDNGRHLSAEAQSELNGRRKLLKAAPSADELEINDEMMQGRKPERFISKSSRALLNGTHKKILVHGWCDTGSPFPLFHFQDAIEFADPGTSNPTSSSWSNNEFARKIDKFGDDNNLHGCGIIAHSQGGLAALHLYTNYWSCLDYGSKGGSSMIQTVGSPYRGSPLQGVISAIGPLFGQGCGLEYDLTEGGADSWLNGIPYWARQHVHYYTTGYKDYWWSYDYCNFATDLILDNPDDGAVEKGRSQLSGGNNMGHTEGWCHTLGMSQPAQYWDIGRNLVMDVAARY